jgi:hypothetical protein
MRQTGLVKRTRPPLWATIGSALLGAGAGAGVLALVGDNVKRTNGASESQRDQSISASP